MLCNQKKYPIAPQDGEAPSWLPHSALSIHPPTWGPASKLTAHSGPRSRGPPPHPEARAPVSGAKRQFPGQGQVSLRKARRQGAWRHPASTGDSALPSPAHSSPAHCTNEQQLLHLRGRLIGNRVWWGTIYGNPSPQTGNICPHQSTNPAQPGAEGPPARLGNSTSF